MEFSSLRYEAQGRIARITLNRPERLNAIDYDDAARDPPRGGASQRRRREST